MALSTPQTVRSPRSDLRADGLEGGGVTEWQATGRRRERVKTHRWRRFMWSLVYPYRGNRLLLTLPGAIVIVVALGIAGAAYNTSSNILFIALSLVLTCLVFSGMLSWLNLSRLQWRLRLQAPLRAGMEHVAAIELHNRKRMLPTYGLLFSVVSSDEKVAVQLPLRERLGAGETTSLEWMLKPKCRGKFSVSLELVASLFPFGFLKKTIGGRLKREVLVWPAPVEYQRFTAVSRALPGQVEQSTKLGHGGEFVAVRNYIRGDSQRHVHWRASARLRRLMVRQFSAESRTGYSLWLRTRAVDWPRAEQFELMCRLAATLAEDLFRAGRLLSVSVDEGGPRPVRRIQDLESFLDQLALVQPTAEDSSPAQRESNGSGRVNLLTFAPDGARGVTAYLNGIKAATA